MKAIWKKFVLCTIIIYYLIQFLYIFLHQSIINNVNFVLVDQSYSLVNCSKEYFYDVTKQMVDCRALRGMGWNYLPKFFVPSHPMGRNTHQKSFVRNEHS